MTAPTECNDNDSPWLICKTCVADGKCARNTRTEFEAAASELMKLADIYATAEAEHVKAITDGARVAKLHAALEGRNNARKALESAIAAHAAQTDRERFEAAAYRWRRQRWVDDGEDGDLEIFTHVQTNAEFDTAIAAAMGWHTVPEQEPDYRERYYSLVMPVGNKYPGESRHETAARYIRQAETSSSGAAQIAPTPKDPT